MRAKVCFGWKTDILPGFLKASDDAVDTPSQCNSAASDNREPFNPAVAIFHRSEKQRQRKPSFHPQRLLPTREMRVGLQLDTRLVRPSFCHSANGNSFSEIIAAS